MLRVPEMQVQQKVNDLTALVKKNFEELRQSKWSQLQGFLSNKWKRFWDQSDASKQAAVAKLAGAALIKIVIPPIALVKGAAQEGVDKLIEHFQHSALSAGFDVRSDVSGDDWKTEMQKMQGEYAVQKLAQTIVDAVRKVEVARAEMENAYLKAKDCATFVLFLAAAEYFYHRVDRLEMYNAMLKIWTQGVGENLENLQRDCKERRGQTTALATSIVGNFKTHFENCKDKEYCLFDPDWLRYVYAESPPPPTGAPPATRIVPPPRTPWPKL